MKFGKRLAAEAARRWATFYLDYKKIKRAIKEDLVADDAVGAHFQKALVEELGKISKFYSGKEQELEASLKKLPTQSGTELAQFRQDVQELIKFGALNYVAVLKAIKKRNRHLKEKFGEQGTSAVRPLDLLLHETFFTSQRLAALATQAEILQNKQRQDKEPADALQDYQCPICLEVLHSPVVLTCTHRFCWGCLVAHCATCKEPHANATSPKVARDGAAAELESLFTLERMVEDSSASYSCPVCRKPQLFDLDALQVDQNLANFIAGLKQRTSAMDSEEPQVVQETAPPAPTVSFLLPPQTHRYKGKLTVALDLDGTLVSSFTPRRAPRLPSYVTTHLVGRGSRLNPHGVFVVERPGLQEFLSELSNFAEVVVFTAGLEDYAAPIIDAIDPQRRFFTARIYREGTTKTDYYQCVKDLARLGRPMQRVALVDDTPLAFLHQPSNGVPILGFRGDPDDRLLLEAVLPFLQLLAAEADVTPVLQKRFDMANWFKRHGYPIEQIVADAVALADPTVALARAAAAATQLAASPQPAELPGEPCGQPPLPAAMPAQCAPADAASSHEQSTAEAMVVSATSPKRTLLLTDFDKTLTDCDAGERLIEELAPELLPMLVQLEQPANFVPLTNTLLAEVQRRGVSRDKLLTTLRHMGGELPSASVKLLHWASRKGVDVRILSDCNTVFIGHILTGAKVNQLVKEVITNSAAFERVVDEEPAPTDMWQPRNGKAEGALGGSSRPASHKLVITPRHGLDLAPHCCRLCPDNLCKGAEVRRLRSAQQYTRIVYCGDGANDICPALAMAPGDVVLARKGYDLAKFLAESASRPDGPRVTAEVRLWEDHEQLLRMVKDCLA